MITARLLLFCLISLLYNNSTFSQIGRDEFRFEYNNIEYHGFIEYPSSQQTKGLIVVIPGHGSTDFVAGRDYHELIRTFSDNGFAVCVWDKAGCGKSEGVYNHDQSIESSAEEATSAISKLKELKVAGSARIGLWGISRAGWICPLVIEKNPDIVFWISVSGTDQYENSRYLLEANLRAEGRSEAQIGILMNEWEHYQKILVRGGQTLEKFLNAIPNLMNDPYFNPDNFQFTEESFKAVQNAYQNSGVNYDETTHLAIMIDEFEKKLSNLNIPVLAIFGEKDSQVDWRNTQRLYKQTIGNNPKATLSIKTFPKGNHTIQKCESGGVNEGLEKFNYAFCEGYHQTMIIWLSQLH